jgi:hypothetical protein
MIFRFEATRFFNASFLTTTAGYFFMREIVSMRTNPSQPEAALMVDPALTLILIFTDQSVSGG